AMGEICGVAVAVDALGIETVVCSPLPMGRGLVDAAHGRLPLPAPATLALLEGAPVVGVDLDAELVTPTGAALVAALAAGYGPLPAMTLGQVGSGAGTRDRAELPTVGRAIVGATGSTGASSTSRPSTPTASAPRGSPARPSRRSGPGRSPPPTRTSHERRAARRPRAPCADVRQRDRGVLGRRRLVARGGGRGARPRRPRARRDRGLAGRRRRRARRRPARGRGDRDRPRGDRHRRARSRGLPAPRPRPLLLLQAR